MVEKKRFAKVGHLKVQVVRDHKDPRTQDTTYITLKGSTIPSKDDICELLYAVHDDYENICVRVTNEDDKVPNDTYGRKICAFYLDASKGKPQPVDLLGHYELHHAIFSRSGLISVRDEYIVKVTRDLKTVIICEFESKKPIFELNFGLVVD
jgi:hypothetical protein